MKANQQISVIIPMYNAENTVMKALDSVRLQKGDFVFEIIIVNDGSTDASRNVVENYRKQNPQMNIILLDQPNSGVSKARNAAMEVSGGEYIALLDSDDEWLPNKLEVQIKLINDNPELDFLGGPFNETCLKIFTKKIDSLYNAKVSDICIKNFPQPSTVIFKKSIFVVKSVVISPL